jgi:hypothetical protein
MAPSTKPGWIEWRDCVPKHIIMEDLETGVLPDNEEELSAAEAWSICYQHLAEFVTAGVVFDQFKERLRDHRKQIRCQKTRATDEEEAMVHDRGMFPRQTKNHRGEPVFDVSNAKILLRGDVADGKHLTMKPAELQRTRREHNPFEPRKFKERMCQEVRRVKFINCLEQKRADQRKTKKDQKQ